MCYFVKLLNRVTFYCFLFYVTSCVLISYILFSDVNVASANVKILNVSYDATRELYQEYNTMFMKYWNAKTGQDVIIQQSHGGSGKQSRAVADGLEADIVTLASAYDIDIIATNAQLLPKTWQSRLPNNSAPYTSTIMFLVRSGNPKNIKDWDDLIRPGVSVITPNPKTSGIGCWNYLAALGYMLLKSDRDMQKTQDFITKLYGNVEILNSGSRDATTAFMTRGIGDVLINWENEIFLASKEITQDKFDIVIPSVSIVAEPVVSIVDKNTEKHNTTNIAKAYLEYLYSQEAQELIARHYFRPSDKEIAKKYNKQFPAIKLFTLQEIIGNWSDAYKIHFKDGGVFDQIYQKKN